MLRSWMVKKNEIDSYHNIICDLVLREAKHENPKKSDVIDLTLTAMS